MHRSVSLWRSWRLQNTCANSKTFRLLKKQLAFLLARQQIYIEVEDASLADCLNNTHLSEHFISLARELDVLEPKTPEDIYKSHLENISKLRLIMVIFHMLKDHGC